VAWGAASQRFPESESSGGVPPLRDSLDATALPGTSVAGFLVPPLRGSCVGAFYFWFFLLLVRLVVAIRQTLPRLSAGAFGSLGFYGG
jgi:hypothetical protein